MTTNDDGLSIPAHLKREPKAPKATKPAPTASEILETAHAPSTEALADAVTTHANAMADKGIGAAAKERDPVKALSAAKAIGDSAHPAVLAKAKAKGARPAKAKAKAKPAAKAKAQPKATKPAKAKAASPKPATKASKERKESKQALFIEAMRTAKGISITEAAERFEWLAHTVRGAVAGALKAKLGLKVEAERDEKRGTVYRIK
jgi:hypothetical protein